MVRSFYRAVRAGGGSPPYDTLALKIYYPARFGNTAQERNTGVIPADPAGSPYPAVLFLPGINVGSEGYQWLAVSLAEAGCVVVTFNWVAEEMPGFISLTPGMDLARVRPDTWGSGPTCPAVQPVLDELAALNENGLLAGMLDLERVYLGGHSAGGTMALQNANADWFPQVCGAFAYAGHTGASTMLGWPERTFLAPSGQVPLLIVGGEQDGVIAASAGRYGAEASATGPLRKTFQQVPAPGAGTVLVFLAGAGHFLPVHPVDQTAGRHFLEGAPAGTEALRMLLAEMVAAFVHHPEMLERFAGHPLVAEYAEK